MKKLKTLRHFRFEPTEVTVLPLGKTIYLTRATRQLRFKIFGEFAIFFMGVFCIYYKWKL